MGWSVYDNGGGWAVALHLDNAGKDLVGRVLDGREDRAT